MRIGVIGSGMIGGTAARLLIQAGHEVAIANSRGPASLRAFVQNLGPRACATTVEEAVEFADVVLLALPWRHKEELPSPELFAGKLVIDATNPYAPDGSLFALGDSTSSEEVGKRLPGARLVKAFNTIYFEDLAHEGKVDAPLDEQRVIFLAGDDARAKHTVAHLIEELGFAPFDTGSLREGGRLQQPGSPLYNRSMKLAEARAILAQAPSEEGLPAPS